MREVTQWWSQASGSDDTWLILGKGPTLERKDEFDFGAFRIIGLNHVIRDIPVEVLSVMDMDVIAECAHEIDRNARFLLMPRYPHVNFRPSEQPLETFFGEFSILEKLSKADRLVWYNYADSEKELPSPQVPEGYFSGEVIIKLLAVLGARSIRTLGVDGGTAYSSRFAEKTPLANQHSSFDLQWSGITETVHRYGIDYAPPDHREPGTGVHRYR